MNYNIPFGKKRCFAEHHNQNRQFIIKMEKELTTQQEDLILEQKKDDESEDLEIKNKCYFCGSPATKKGRVLEGDKEDDIIYCYLCDKCLGGLEENGE